MSPRVVFTLAEVPRLFGSGRVGVVRARSVCGTALHNNLAVTKSEEKVGWVRCIGVLSCVVWRGKRVHVLIFSRKDPIAVGRYSTAKTPLTCSKIICLYCRSFSPGFASLRAGNSLSSYAARAWKHSERNGEWEGERRVGGMRVRASKEVQMTCGHDHSSREAREETISFQAGIIHLTARARNSAHVYSRL